MELVGSGISNRTWNGLARMKVKKNVFIPDYHAQLAINLRPMFNFICAMAEDPGALREHETTLSTGSARRAKSEPKMVEFFSTKA
jgi:hypothetical protein